MLFVSSVISYIPVYNKFKISVFISIRLRKIFFILRAKSKILKIRHSHFVYRVQFYVLSVFRPIFTSKLYILETFKHVSFALKMAKHDVIKTPFPQEFLPGYFWNLDTRRQIEAGWGTESFASISAAVFDLSRKLGRGQNLPLPLILPLSFWQTSRYSGRSEVGEEAIESSEGLGIP